MQVLQTPNCARSKDKIPAELVVALWLPGGRFLKHWNIFVFIKELGNVWCCVIKCWSTRCSRDFFRRKLFSRKHTGPVSTWAIIELHIRHFCCLRNGEPDFRFLGGLSLHLQRYSQSRRPSVLPVGMMGHSSCWLHSQLMGVSGIAPGKIMEQPGTMRPSALWIALLNYLIA